MEGQLCTCVPFMVHLKMEVITGCLGGYGCCIFSVPYSNHDRGRCKKGMVVMVRYVISIPRQIPLRVLNHGP